MPDLTHLFWLFLIFASFIAAFTVLVNGILLKFSRTLGIRERTTTIIRWSAVSKPALGGITFFIVFLITLACFPLFFPGETYFQNKEAIGLVLVCILAFMMGLADDAYNTKPVLKFSVQFLCGIVLYFSGVYIQTTPWEWLNIALTLLWVAGIMNSINMLDNMDGISTSVSAGIIAIFILCIVLTGNMMEFELFVLVGVLASLAGFLFHNWHPSRMFMGDTGSQFLGVFLAYFGIKLFWNGVDNSGQVIQAKQFTLVLIGFMPTLLDTGVVVINRLLKGKSPFVGGKDHTTHHLSYLGFSDSQVGFIFIGITFISGILVYLMLQIIDEWTHLITLLFWCYFFSVFCLLFFITRKNRHYEQQGRKKEQKTA